MELICIPEIENKENMTCLIKISKILNNRIFLEGFDKVQKS